MTRISRPNPEYLSSFLYRIRKSSAAWSILVLLTALAMPASAQGPQPAATLKNAVIPVGASSTNDTLLISVPSGPLDLDLYLQVDKALSKQIQGKLIVTNFLAQTTPADVVKSTIRFIGTKSNSDDNDPLQVTLTPPDLLHVRLTGGALRSGTIYKGALFLNATGQSNRWDITLTTGALGTIAVDPVGTMKFVTLSPCALLKYLSSCIDNCEPSAGSFPVTIHDKSEGGPYRHLRVRFEASGTAVSKATTSNFSLDSFSFYETKDGKLQRIDLEQRTGVAPDKVKSTDSHGINLDYRGQRTFTASIMHLSPGEYTGALRFAADESAQDAQDAKLPLTIQVRHHWLLPFAVILIGSLLGWFSSKYVVGVRKAGELARRVKALRERAEDLARPDDHSERGWQFPSEATSYGLARVRVLLSKLGKLACSAFPILIREEEILQQREDAERRLTSLESLRDTRRQLQQIADGRPAAQLALGRLLRRARDLIERPTFGQAQQTILDNLLKTAEPWLDETTLPEKYRESLVDRLNSQEIPNFDDLKSLHNAGSVKTQLLELTIDWPTKDKITNEVNLDVLKGYDQRIAKMALLWREWKNDMPWARELADACERNESLEELFHFVDMNLWRTLDDSNTAGQLKIEPVENAEEKLLTYDLAEFLIKSNIPKVDSLRIRRHPLHVCWRIISPGGTVRSTESHDLNLVQYFPRSGNVIIKAILRWQGHEILLNDQKQLNILPNPEFKSRRIFYGGITEWMVILIAAGFAAATAMSTVYDSTFGSFSQYLSLFLWAAGAGTGGNIIKQLGATSTPGGQPDVTLSTTTAGVGATTPK